jgi:hypothetical protein
VKHREYFFQPGARIGNVQFWKDYYGRIGLLFFLYRHIELRHIFFFQTPTQYPLEGPTERFPLQSCLVASCAVSKTPLYFLRVHWDCLVGDMAICIHIGSSDILELDVKFYLFAALLLYLVMSLDSSLKPVANFPCVEL